MAYSEQEKKQHIAELQQYLRGISYMDSSVPRIIPDGIYGPETRKAVEIFQKKNDIPVTGVVDAETWQAIYNEYLRLQKLNNLLLTISPFASADATIEEGDSGYIVYLIQAMLNTIAQFFVNINKANMSGVVDDSTVKTIKQLQNVAGETATGNVDAQTWNALARMYDIYIKKALMSEKMADNSADSSKTNSTNNKSTKSNGTKSVG